MARYVSIADWAADRTPLSNAYLNGKLPQVDTDNARSHAHR